MEFLAGFSLTQIIFCVVGIILAFKGGWDLFDYFKGKYDEKFNKDYSKIKQQELLMEHYKNCKSQHDETMVQYESLSGKLDGVVNSIDDLSEKVNKLGQNDQHTIKQIIVKEYHSFMKKGWIDDFSLDTLMLLYEDYKKLGGNSYVANLMDELKRLPREEKK